MRDGGEWGSDDGEKKGDGKEEVGGGQSGKGKREGGRAKGKKKAGKTVGELLERIAEEQGAVAWEEWMCGGMRKGEGRRRKLEGDDEKEWMYGPHRVV